MGTKILTIAAALAVVLATPAAAGDLPCFLQKGDACKGAPGLDGKDGIDGKDGAPGYDGKDGKDGKDGAPGRDGRDADPRGLAIGMAMANPIWLEPGETFSLSGGVGTFDSETAVAATGVVRIDGNFSLNGSVGTDIGLHDWGARAGW